MMIKPTLLAAALALSAGVALADPAPPPQPPQQQAADPALGELNTAWNALQQDMVRVQNAMSGVVQKAQRTIGRQDQNLSTLIEGNKKLADDNKTLKTSLADKDKLLAAAEGKARDLTKALAEANKTRISMAAAEADLVRQNAAKDTTIGSLKNDLVTAHTLFAEPALSGSVCYNGEAPKNKLPQFPQTPQPATGHPAATAPR